MEAKVKYLVEWLRSKQKESGAAGFVVGLSGGVDSSVVAYLIQLAAPGQSLGVIMPCDSNPGDRSDAIAAAEKAELPYIEVDLTDNRRELFLQIKTALKKEGISPNDVPLTWGNMAARLRMTTLYGVANQLNYLVVGTDNAAEVFTGYFTKYGDGGVDLVPLANLPKREVYEMASYLGVPETILTKAPSAGLFKGQTDEGEMGVDYNTIDDFLQGKAIPAEKKEIIMKLHDSSVHKRAMPAAPVKTTK